MHRVLVAFFLVTMTEANFAATGNLHQGEPIRMINGYPVVSAFLNDRGPFRMLLDTGATRCALRPTVAARLGLVVKCRLLLTTVSGEQMVSAAQVAIRLPSSNGLNAEVLIYDLPALDRLESPVDGLLGQSFLAQGPYLIDYRAKRLWLGNAAQVQAQRLSLPLPVEFSYGRPIVLVRTSSQAEPFRLVLDSGVHCLLFRCANRCPDLLESGTLRAVSNAGVSEVRAGRLPAALIGPIRLFGRQAILMKQSPDRGEGEGSVPLQWFSAVYVDPAQSLVRLAR
jgi:Aspartyl protease